MLQTEEKERASAHRQCALKRGRKRISVWRRTRRKLNKEKERLDVWTDDRKRSGGNAKEKEEER